MGGTALAHHPRRVGTTFDHMKGKRLVFRTAAVAGAILTLAASLSVRGALPTTREYEFNDSHFHLTNYIQEEIDIRKFLGIMGYRVDGRFWHPAYVVV